MGEPLGEGSNSDRTEEKKRATAGAAKSGRGKEVGLSKEKKEKKKSGQRKGGWTKREGTTFLVTE